MIDGRPRRLIAVVPAYQAASRVGDVVARTARVVPAVIVVDDGSTDGTGLEAERAGAAIVRLPENRGKGAALRAGFARALESGCDAVVTLDADGQHLPEEIPRLVAAWKQGADLVLGSRSALFGEFSRVRRLSNRLSSRAISFAAGTPIGDIQTGFRLYGRRLLESVPFHGDRFDAESAVVVRAARRGYRIRSVPVRLEFADGRRTSHYRPLVDSLRIAAAVTRARLGERW